MRAGNQSLCRGRSAGKVADEIVIPGRCEHRARKFELPMRNFASGLSPTTLACSPQKLATPATVPMPPKKPQRSINSVRRRNPGGTAAEHRNFIFAVERNVTRFPDGRHHAASRKLQLSRQRAGPRALDGNALFTMNAPFTIRTNPQIRFCNLRRPSCCLYHCLLIMVEKKNRRQFAVQASPQVDSNA